MLISTLNQYAGCDMEGLIQAVKQEIDGFAAGTAQFDDITMLAFRLGAPLSEMPISKSEITVKPLLEEPETDSEHGRPILS